MSEYFFEQMRGLLGARYTEFKAAYDLKPRHKALRVNTLKVSPNGFLPLFESVNPSAAALRPNPLCAQSFYTDIKPSTDPLYHAGLYYMQEPSASAAVAAFAPFIGERTLDLCAAPGGKATQAAAVMNGRGVLFCNDPERSRVAALKENIARLGVRNAVVTNATAADYVKAGFCEYFDTLIIDAPCSGGGMMRYETVPYTAEIVNGCAERQRRILDDAVKLLCGGGYMLYSTCTFSERENEENIAYLLDKGFETVDIPLKDGEERGIGIADARRIYPHNFDGEGHFYCVLKKTVGSRREIERAALKPIKVNVCGAVLDAVSYSDVARLPAEFPELGFIKKFTAAGSVGVSLFERVTNNVRDKRTGKRDHKAEFSHELTHALTADEVRAVGSAELGADGARRYIRGEQLDISAPTGMKIATVCGYALGWVKSAPTGSGEQALKNLYPKSLRV